MTMYIEVTKSMFFAEVSEEDSSLSGAALNYLWERYQDISCNHDCNFGDDVMIFRPADIVMGITTYADYEELANDYHADVDEKFVELIQEHDIEEIDMDLVEELTAEAYKEACEELDLVIIELDDCSLLVEE